MLATSTFLQGAFAPVTDEVTAFDLPVTGRIPAELNGRYLRNGPNPLGLDDPGYHWFIGAGMVHGVRLRDGRAEWYRNRWVRSRAVAEALGEPWPAGPVHDGDDFPANTHIIGHAGRTLATVEAGALPYELTGELETRGPRDFGGTLPGGFAAHTKLDPRTGELHAVAYYWAWDYVQHIVIGPAGEVTRTTNIPIPDRPMMHDFALTRKLDIAWAGGSTRRSLRSRVHITWRVSWLLSRWGGGWASGSGRVEGQAISGQPVRSGTRVYPSSLARFCRARTWRRVVARLS
jgi:carotenoid cleavage dioxygenase